jgi:hypothetical protein
MPARQERRHGLVGRRPQAYADIDVLLQQMRCKPVPKRMRCHPLGDLRHMSGGMNGAIELARGEMVDGVLSGKQADLGSRDPPPVAQQLEQLRRA